MGIPCAMGRSAHGRWRHRRGGWLVAIILTGIVATACGEPQLVITSGTMGTNAELGPVLLRNVYVEAPRDARYAPGDDAVVRLRLFNRAQHPDALLGVRTPVAQRVSLRSDRDCDGTVRTVAELRLPNRHHLPEPPHDYYLQLVGLTEEVRAGATVPLRFQFARAGTITVRAMVASPEDAAVPAVPNCAAGQKG